MKNFLRFFIFLVLIACENHPSPYAGNPKKPDSIISRDQMVRILTDVHLTEAALTSLKTRGKLTTGLSDDYYNAVFSKYKISRKRFTSNFDYYNRDQEEMIKIYGEVIKNLDAMKSSKKPAQ